MPRTIDRLPTILSGVSGQYFVAAELSRRGYIATLTLRNTRGVDILAARADASKSVGIQVKTNQGQKKVWLLDKKAEDVTADNLVYVFVSLNGCSGRPSFHIVPSRAVADYSRRRHAKWLAGVSKQVAVRKDNSLRKFADPEGIYLEEWKHLGL